MKDKYIIKKKKQTPKLPYVETPCRRCLKEMCIGRYCNKCKRIKDEK